MKCGKSAVLIGDADDDGTAVAGADGDEGAGPDVGPGGVARARG
jgi:hypothetical protein